MSSKIFTPVNQVKLTNVSVVRLKKGGQRFELACYKNKVAEYRNGITRDLDEVLQSNIIFSNVSKGQAARETDIRKIFGPATKLETIIEEILQKGEVQVGSEERGQALQMMSREVATIVADKCLNPHTKVPYPVGLIEQALREAHFAPNLAKSAKQQALEAIRLLAEPARQAQFPIARAQMRILVAGPITDAASIDAVLASLGVNEREEDMGAGPAPTSPEGGGPPPSYRVTCLVDPGKFRPLCEAMAKATKSRGAVQVINLKNIRESSGSDVL